MEKRWRTQIPTRWAPAEATTRKVQLTIEEELDLEVCELFQKQIRQLDVLKSFLCPVTVTNSSALPPVATLIITNTNIQEQKQTKTEYIIKKLNFQIERKKCSRWINDYKKMQRLQTGQLNCWKKPRKLLPIQRSPSKQLERRKRPRWMTTLVSKYKYCKQQDSAAKKAQEIISVSKILLQTKLENKMPSMHNQTGIKMQSGGLNC